MGSDPDSRFTIGVRPLIEQYVNDKAITLERCCCEWCDNSFGAGANRVEFIQKGDCLIIKDDGRGCPDLDVMIGIGQSGGESLMKRYGMGGTIAGIRESHGGVVRYESIQDGMKRFATADWPTIMETGDCLVTHRRHERTDEPDGTTIFIHGFRGFSSLPDIAKKLGFAYRDLLVAGKGIIFRTSRQEVRVAPYIDPVLATQVAFNFEVDGLPIEGECGLVSDWGGDSNPGFHIRWGFRYGIKSNAPCVKLGISPSKIFCRMRLADGWPAINLTKDELGDHDEEIWDKVMEYCRPILEQAARASTSFRLLQLQRDVAGLLTRAITKVKQRRKRNATPAEPGTKIPTGEGRSPRRAAKVRPGDKELETTVPEPARHAFDVVFDDWPDPFKVDFVGERALITVSTRFAPMARLQALEDPQQMLQFLGLAFCRELEDSAHQERFGFRAEEPWMDMFRTLMENLPEVGAPASPAQGPPKLGLVS